MLPWNREPARAATRRYPYLVVHLLPAAYQREVIAVHRGEAPVHVGHRDSFVHHPDPFATDGSITGGCKELMVASTLDAVPRTRFRMCVVWSATSCTFVERDGSTKESDDPPSSGLGTGGVGGCSCQVTLSLIGAGRQQFGLIVSYRDESLRFAMMSTMNAMSNGVPSRFLCDESERRHGKQSGE